MTQQYV